MTRLDHLFVTGSALLTALQHAAHASPASTLSASSSADLDVRVSEVDQVDDARQDETITAPKRELHPGAIAYGRGSCGDEYSRAEIAYNFPNIAVDSLFVRRVQTVENPYFWTQFETTRADQDFYISAWTPEMVRFQDRQSLNGFIFGPGLPLLTDSELERVATILMERGGQDVMENMRLATGSQDATKLKYDEAVFRAQNGKLVPKDTFFHRGVYWSSPSSDLIRKCLNIGNLKSHPIMRHYAQDLPPNYKHAKSSLPTLSDEEKLRCMQRLNMNAIYADFLVRSAQMWDFWLYSETRYLSTPGRYKMVSWLVPSDISMREFGQLTNAVAGTNAAMKAPVYNRPVISGKYELTLAPNRWGSANSSTLAEAQAQGTTCSCSVNAIDWMEQHTSRVGIFARTFWEQQSPFFWLKRRPANALLPVGAELSGRQPAVMLLPWGTDLLDSLRDTFAFLAYADQTLFMPPRKHQENGFANVTAFDARKLGIPDRTSQCISKPKVASLPAGGKSHDLIEWSGVFQLEYGKTYHWTWHGYRELGPDTFRYPDAAVDVLIVAEDDWSCAKKSGLQDHQGKILKAASPVSVPPQTTLNATFDGSARSKYDGDFLELTDGLTYRIHMNNVKKTAAKDMNGGALPLNLAKMTPEGPTVTEAAQLAYFKSAAGASEASAIATKLPAVEQGKWHFGSVETTVKLTRPAAASHTSKYYFLSVYTQHRPEEFMAGWLQEVEDIPNAEAMRTDHDSNTFVPDKVVRRFVYPQAEQVYSGDVTAGANVAATYGTDGYSGGLSSRRCDRWRDAETEGVADTTIFASTGLDSLQTALLKEGKGDNLGIFRGELGGMFYALSAASPMKGTLSRTLVLTVAALVTSTIFYVGL
ncbi:unnamed protein product [Amoebophrya sp. A25]|nr:unnamed protein product [Amoebophrya sp. A25]|eukprot:GSA25T00019248001.1